MKLFSQRMGFKPVKSKIQYDSIDKDLRNSLWNAVTIVYWQKIEGWISDDREISILFKKIWLDYFKRPIDTLDDYWDYTRKEIREYFLKCKWNEVYDFIEFIANNYPNNLVNQKFTDLCNSYLKKELSVFRFVGGKITKITSEEEITEIEDALKTTRPFKQIRNHLTIALDHLADRNSPDYRNSIKESISAVEGICKLIEGNPKSTLGKALNRIESKISIHSDLKDAFKNLYGYTSDSDGIRHALMNESNLDFEDAKFMLVSCSAFINYLIVKASKAGIKI